MATARQAKECPFYCDINRICSVFVHNDFPENTGANILLDCFETDKPHVEIKIEKRKASGFCYVQFPVPSYTQTDAEDMLRERLHKLIQGVNDIGDKMIAVLIDDLHTWKKETFCETVLTKFLQLAQSKAPMQDHKMTLNICSLKSRNFFKAIEVCQKVTKKTGNHQPGRGLNKKKESRMQNHLSISVEKGCLEKTEADVLACAISSDLDLRRGAVSGAMLKQGGPALQRDLDKRYPKGEIPYGKIVMIPGYHLACKHVLFGVLYPFNWTFAKGYESPEGYYRASVAEFVKTCLNDAEKNGCKTIAFPAVGAGTLGYPEETVAEQMFETVIEWSQTSDAVFLETVRFIIYPDDTYAFKAFQEVENRYEMHRRQPQQKTSESCVKFNENRIIHLEGYPAELILEYCKDSISSLEEADCSVEFKRDEVIVRGPSDVLDIAFVKMEDAVKGMKQTFSASEYIATPPSCTNLSESDVAEIKTMKSDLNVRCIFDKIKARWSIFGKSLHEVKEAKDKIEKYLLHKTTSQNHSKDVQQKKNARSSFSLRQKTVYNQKSQLSTDTEVYETKEKIAVKVYLADALSVPVDCVVTAADKRKEHIRGKGRAATKAGLKDPTDDQIKRYRRHTGGATCSTDTGIENDKFIVHVAEPCWEDYKPYSLEDVERCETDLYNAILESLTKVEEKQMQTVVVASIGTGSSGCPLDLCCVQYANAVNGYSKLAMTPLKEIHFVDNNIEMVELLQKTFQTMIPDEKVPKNYNKLKHVNLRATITTMHSDEGNHSGRSRNANHMKEPDRIKTPHNDKSGVVTYPYNHKDYPPGQKRKTFACCFGPGQNLYVYSTDIFSLTGIELIVCANTPDGKGKGFLTKTISEKGGPPYKKEKEQIFKKKVDLGNVVVCQGGNMKNFKWVAHAILFPKTACKNEEDRRFKVTQTFFTIFEQLVQKGCQSMALPLIGTGLGKGDPVYYAQRFIDGLLQFSEVNDRLNFKVHLVHKESERTHIVENTVKKAIQEAQTRHQKQKELSSRQNRPARPASGPSFKKQSVNNEAYYGRKKHTKSNYPGGDKLNDDMYNHKDDQDRMEDPSMNSGQSRTSPTAFKQNDTRSKENENGKEIPVRSQRGQVKTQCNWNTKASGDALNCEVTAIKETAEMSKPQGNLSIIDETSSVVKPIDDEETTDMSEEEEEEEEEEGTDEFSAEELDQGLKKDIQDDTEVETCVICMDEIIRPHTLPCGHMFCSDCIQQQFVYKEACPTCGKVCGIITGDQPDGTIDVIVNDKASCAGYEDCGRIEITYRFPEGKQGPSHPSPGTRYKGITRTAYLPNNRRGKEICAMLRVAFDRKLIFTIGRSRTTGAEGVITWNDIHHKTDPRPKTQFGYPDPTYLDRVTEELEIKGVTANDIATLSASRGRHR